MEIKKLPPFSWNRRYLKCGIILSFWSYGMNLLFTYLLVILGVFFQPVLWLFITGLTWIMKPVLIEKTRPCSDCRQSGVKCG